MKTAICFSGAIRSFDSCYNSVNRYFLSCYENCDIFLHMWIIDEVDRSLSVNFKMRPYKFNINEFLNILQPKKYVIDNYNSNWEKKILDTINMTDKDFGEKKNYSYNAMGMYYKINLANELKCQYEIENDFKYDFVWRARLDYIFLDYLRIPDQIQDDTIYLVRDRYATRSRLNTNDKFFGGKSDVMDDMCNIFYKIPEYYNNGMFIEGQTLCENHIKLSNFKVEFLGDDKTYYKCQGRHDLSNLNGNIFIDQINSPLSYNIAFYLLHHNYGIVYEEIDDKYKKLELIKHCYHFEENNKYILKLVFVGENNIFINSNRVCVFDTKLIDNIWVCHFVLSLIRNHNKVFDNYYQFKDIKQLKLAVGEKIEYLIADKGFVVGTITETINKGRYKITPKIEGDIIHKSYIIPWNLYEHYKADFLPVIL
jgi:hypothetical protein